MLWSRRPLSTRRRHLPATAGLALLAALAAAMAAAACTGAGSSSSGAAAGAAAPASAPASSAPATSTTVRRAATYVFPVQPIASCHVSYGHFHHDYPATDIFARKGCRFVAPTSGVVTEVRRTDPWDPATDRGADRGGRSVAMVGDDGVRYYGSHLERVDDAIGPGTRVRAGQRLGLIDNSGDARYVATHLHFGISWNTRDGVWWVRRGIVPPWPFLDAWRAGRASSPAAAVRAALARAGQRVPPCRGGC